MRVLTTGTKQRLERVTFSPDGSRLAAAGAEGAYLWTLADSAEPRRFGRGYAWGVGFVTGRDCLVVSSGLGGTVVHALAAGTEHPVRLRSVAFSPDGVLAAAGSDTGKVVVWDVDL
jgi:WD40 repeat protein